MDSREKALELLKAQIRQQKARIRPEILALAQESVSGAEAGNESGDIPYDKKSAAKAVELFLKSRNEKTPPH